MDDDRSHYPITEEELSIFSKNIPDENIEIFIDSFYDTESYDLFMNDISVKTRLDMNGGEICGVVWIITYYSSNTRVEFSTLQELLEFGIFPDTLKIHVEMDIYRMYTTPTEYIDVCSWDRLLSRKYYILRKNRNLHISNGDITHTKFSAWYEYHINNIDNVFILNECPKCLQLSTKDITPELRELYGDLPDEEILKSVLSLLEPVILK